ncbi:homeobox protein, partial [Zopfia rhizophila CBS 207.26]
RKSREWIPKGAKDILATWFNAHRNFPYPTKDEKIYLCNQTGLSINKVSDWFDNRRRAR